MLKMSKTIDIIKKYSDRYLNSKIIFTIDVILSAISSALVLLLAFFVVRSDVISREFSITYLISSVLASVLMFYITKTYRIIIRHLSVRDIGVFFVACLGKVLLTALVMVRYRELTTLWISLTADFLFTTFLLVGTRMVMIFAYQFFIHKIQESKEQQRVLVYGTSDKAIAAVVRLQNSPHFRVMGFLVESKNKLSSIIERLPVESFNSKEDVQRIIEKYRLDGILFATERDAQNEKDRLIQFCMDNSMKCLIIPTTEEITDPQFILKPREVKVEDLLGREEIKISLKRIKEDFEGKVVMVSGAAGSIGSELCRQIAGFGVKSLILFDNAETPMHNLRLELEDTFHDLEFYPMIGDVRQMERLDYVFRRFHPQIVFHAAAYKHVPLMEDSPNEAIKNNTIGTYKTAYAAMVHGCERFVLISTDKAVNPTNIMGASKRLCEMIIQSFDAKIKAGQAAEIPQLFTHSGIENADKDGTGSVFKDVKTEFVAVRFGNVLGSNGSVIPLFKKWIEQGGPVKVTHPDIIRYFMTIPEAVSLVLLAGTYAKGGEIFVLDMGSPVKIDDLARNMIRLSGYKPDVDIKIVYSGLRPGEKLYEEKLMAEEGLTKTDNKLIHIGKPIPFDTDVFLSQLKDLMYLAYSNKQYVRTQVENMVSTYHPVNNKKPVVKDKTYNTLIEMPIRTPSVQVASFTMQSNNRAF